MNSILKIISSEIEVRRYRHRDEFGGTQRLEKHWKLFGITVFIKVLDQETVP